MFGVPLTLQKPKMKRKLLPDFWFVCMCVFVFLFVRLFHFIFQYIWAYGIWARDYGPLPVMGCKNQTKSPGWSLKTETVDQGKWAQECKLISCLIFIAKVPLIKELHIWFLRREGCFTGLHVQDAFAFKKHLRHGSIIYSNCSLVIEEGFSHSFLWYLQHFLAFQIFFLEISTWNISIPMSQIHYILI